MVRIFVPVMGVSRIIWGWTGRWSIKGLLPNVDDLLRALEPLLVAIMDSLLGTHLDNCLLGAGCAMLLLRPRKAGGTIDIRRMGEWLTRFDKVRSSPPPVPGTCKWPTSIWGLEGPDGDPEESLVLREFSWFLSLIMPGRPLKQDFYLLFHLNQFKLP